MDKFSELKAAAMAATPQKIDGAQEKTEDGCMECPCCSGDGQVDVGADYCNYDNTAIGVIFYGIGDAHVAAERYFRAANPATVLALLSELEAKDKRIAELEASETQLIQERDSAEQALADMYEAATGERPEWSNWFGFADAIEEVAQVRAKLATPVRLPTLLQPGSDAVNGMIFANGRNEAIAECSIAIRQAGFLSEASPMTVEGDE